MPMYWTFNCFLGCIYTVYYIVHIVFLVLNWLSNLEFRLPKKEDQVARIGVMGGGFRWFGQCPKENVFFPLMSSLTQHSWNQYSFTMTHWKKRINRSLSERLTYNNHHSVIAVDLFTPRREWFLHQVTITAGYLLSPLVMRRLDTRPQAQTYMYNNCKD